MEVPVKQSLLVIAERPTGRTLFQVTFEEQVCYVWCHEDYTDSMNEHWEEAWRESNRGHERSTVDLFPFCLKFQNFSDADMAAKGAANGKGKGQNKGKGKGKS